jgi:hypothetical protein
MLAQFYNSERGKAMRIVVFNPNDPQPRVCDIAGDLHSMQDVVNGCIEVVRLHDGNAIVCNEDGTPRDLEPNRIIDGHVYRGTFFVARIMGEKIVSLTLKDAA